MLPTTRRSSNNSSSHRPTMPLGRRGGEPVASSAPYDLTSLGRPSFDHLALAPAAFDPANSHTVPSSSNVGPSHAMRSSLTSLTVPPSSSLADSHASQEESPMLVDSAYSTGSSSVEATRPVAAFAHHQQPSLSSRRLAHLLEGNASPAHLSTLMGDLVTFSTSARTHFFRGEHNQSKSDLDSIKSILGQIQESHEPASAALNQHLGGGASSVDSDASTPAPLSAASITSEVPLWSAHRATTDPAGSGYESLLPAMAGSSVGSKKRAGGQWNSTNQRSKLLRTDQGLLVAPHDARNPSRPHIGHGSTPAMELDSSSKLLQAGYFDSMSQPHLASVVDSPQAASPVETNKQLQQGLAPTPHPSTQLDQPSASIWYPSQARDSELRSNQQFALQMAATGRTTTPSVLTPVDQVVTNASHPHLSHWPSTLMPAHQVAPHLSLSIQPQVQNMASGSNMAVMGPAPDARVAHLYSTLPSHFSPSPGHARAASDSFLLSSHKARPSHCKSALSTPVGTDDEHSEAIPVMPSLSTELQAELDEALLGFLNELCSNLDYKDPRGELVHQLLLPKRMARLDQSPDFRPFRFRIKSFTLSFQGWAQQHGLSTRISPKTLKLYLWSQPLIARFNEDGRKAKSRGNHNWIVDARKRPTGGWEFREFVRRIAGAPMRAYMGQAWTWKLRIWDPLVPSSAIHATFHVRESPAWIRWESEARDTLVGTPHSTEDAGQLTVVANYIQDGQVQELTQSFFLPVVHADLQLDNSGSSSILTTSSHANGAGRVRFPGDTMTMAVAGPSTQLAAPTARMPQHPGDGFRNLSSFQFPPNVQPPMN